MSSHVFDKSKWQSMNIFEQMGNIGSEVGRALSAKRRGDKKSMQGALYRGIDLFNATAETLAASKSPRLKEVLRARDQFTATILGNSTDDGLEMYFMYFAIAARRDR